MNYYDQIKGLLISNEVYKSVKDYSKNRSDLNTYYNVGKILSEAGTKYGENIIGEYSKKLEKELNKKYNERTLRRYRQFYIFATNLKWSALPTKLSWSHITELLSLSDKNEIDYYINKAKNANIGYRQLHNIIKNKEYERLSLEAKIKMNNREKLKIDDMIPNPIIINNKNNTDIVNEKALNKLILEDIPNFLKELGNGYCFIDSEYPIKLGNIYNYIDLLLFNIDFNCYVVVELKVTELKKEHIGQIQIYMNYIDQNLKRINLNNTIGIIICKENNKYVIKYSSDERIISREYLIA